MVRVLFGSEFLPAVYRLVGSAEKNISVVMFEWSWYPGQHTGSLQDINRELCQQAKRGVKVRVLLHNEAMGRALHKINRKTAQHLRQAGAEVKFGNTGIPLHAKVWLFDDKAVVVGSHNLSIRAVRTNEECSILLQDETECDRVRQWFEGLWSRGMEGR